MTQGSFATVVDSFRATLSSLPDKRTGKNTRYEMLDAGLSAFSVFFTPPLVSGPLAKDG